MTFMFKAGGSGTTCVTSPAHQRGGLQFTNQKTTNQKNAELCRHSRGRSGHTMENSGSTSFQTGDSLLPSAAGQRNPRKTPGDYLRRTHNRNMTSKRRLVGTSPGVVSAGSVTRHQSKAVPSSGVLNPILWVRDMDPKSNHHENDKWGQH